jgi:hypothetical protein
LEHVTQIHGLHAERIDPVALRHEGDKPVEGFLVVVRKP